jgi:hypothetical protein
MLIGVLCLLCCCAGVVALPHAGAFAKAKSAAAVYQRRSITGTVVGVGGRLGGRTRPFTLHINNYTSTADVERLNSALESGGQDELLRVLSRMDSGRIQVGTGIGVPANAIISVPQPEGGSRIIVLFERNINFYERRYGTRSEDYRFGYAEMYLGRNGNGQGTFIAAAKVRLRDGNTWEVEDFGAFPARLMGLQTRGARAR